MTNKKKSSIEWLYEELNKPFQKDRHITEIFQQAKEMHKQENDLSFHAGYNYEGGHPIDEFEDYYKKTFEP